MLGNSTKEKAVSSLAEKKKILLARISPNKMFRDYFERKLTQKHKAQVRRFFCFCLAQQLKAETEQSTNYASRAL